MKTLIASIPALRTTKGVSSSGMALIGRNVVQRTATTRHAILDGSVPCLALATPCKAADQAQRDGLCPCDKPRSGCIAQLADRPMPRASYCGTKTFADRGRLS